MFKKLAVVIALVFVATPSFADEVQDTIKTFKAAGATKPFFETAYGYAVFPSIGKVGIVIGGAYGKGQVFKQGKYKGDIEMAQITGGWQLGGQAFSQIVFLQDERAYGKLTGGSFEFSAQATAVALTAGASAKTSTAGNATGAGKTRLRASYVGGMATFTIIKGGLMFEAALGGQKFTFTPKL
jgi:lipid-binding SYLF domain-containing protein